MQRTNWRYVTVVIPPRVRKSDPCVVLIHVAIDIWSAGMILLFFLTGKFPIFQSNDDIEALMEIATIIGKKRMEHAATLHSEFCFRMC